jgi:hypothetical protein
MANPVKLQAALAFQLALPLPSTRLLGPIFLTLVQPSDLFKVIAGLNTFRLKCFFESAKVTIKPEN